MQEAVEDGGGQHLVAGEHLGPVADAFVGGDDRRALAVAVADQPEEQAGVGSIERVESHLVDDEQRGFEILAPADMGRRLDGVPAPASRRWSRSTKGYGSTLAP